ncbi:WD40 repeat domain-containing protein [Paludisphaera soli]|uniref:WD40 repeat domain-containing protein n=1 Tax=Paludisphaera soli TaxID=2712865 RepID=UPI0013EDC24B|nr:WD40 repeat domain-containing protein [Paludisphaera soli]
MQRGWAVDVDESELFEESSEDRFRGRGVRLGFFTWQSLAVVVGTLAIAAALVEEEPVPPVGSEEALALAGHLGLVESIRFSPDGKTLLSLGWDKTVRIWDVEHGPAEEFGQELARLRVDTEIYAAGLSPDGSTVAIAGIDGVTFWDWRDASVPVRSLEGVGPSRALTFSPDGRTLALGGFDHLIRLIDVGAGKVTTSLKGHRDVVRKLAFTPDSRSLISLSFDGSLKSWSIPEGRESSRFRGLEDARHPILTFALAPEGDVLALSRFHVPSQRIEIWDVPKGVLKRYCGDGDAAAHALEFSRSGGMLASSGSDFRIRFWNAETGRAAGSFEENLGWVRTLDFSVDGRWMALSSNPDQVLLKPIMMPSLASHPAAETPRPEPLRTPGEA